jgi:hypothetical protein
MLYAGASAHLRELDYCQLSPFILTEGYSFAVPKQDEIISIFDSKNWFWPLNNFTSQQR